MRSDVPSVHICVVFHQEAVRLDEWHDYLQHRTIVVTLSVSMMHFVIQILCFVFVLSWPDMVVDLIQKKVEWSFISAPAGEETVWTRISIHSKSAMVWRGDSTHSLSSQQWTRQRENFRPFGGNLEHSDTPNCWRDEKDISIETIVWRCWFQGRRQKFLLPLTTSCLYEKMYQYHRNFM